MKKLVFLSSIFLLSLFHLQAQEIIKGQKNTVFLLKGSRAMPEVKFKEGFSILLKNEDDGTMSFTNIKNGKEFPLFKPVNATYGQVAELDVESDGKNEIVAGYRTGPQEFTVFIYKKAQFETDFKLWSTVRGQSYCEFPGNGSVKVYDKTGAFKTLWFGDDGMLKESK
jgi:hypothetical protein